MGVLLFVGNQSAVEPDCGRYTRPVGEVTLIFDVSLGVGHLVSTVLNCHGGLSTRSISSCDFLLNA